MSGSSLSTIPSRHSGQNSGRQRNDVGCHSVSEPTRLIPSLPPRPPAARVAHLEQSHQHAGLLQHHQLVQLVILVPVLVVNQSDPLRSLLDRDEVAATVRLIQCHQHHQCPVLQEWVEQVMKPLPLPTQIRVPSRPSPARK